MNLILFDDTDIVANTTESLTVSFDDRRFRHIRDVHRASTGDRLRLGKINGKMGLGRLVEQSEHSVRFEISRQDLQESPPEPTPLTLFLALPRPKFLSKVLQTVSSLGVKKVFLFHSYRVDKVYWSCDQLSADKIREACLLGLEQARDTVLPDVQTRRLFKPFVEDELPTLISGTKALVAHPGSEEPCPYAVQSPVSLAVGPEGGFIDYEVQKLVSAGFSPIGLSERILKVEAAVTALIARIT